MLADLVHEAGYELRCDLINAIVVVAELWRGPFVLIIDDQSVGGRGSREFCRT